MPPERAVRSGAPDEARRSIIADRLLASPVAVRLGIVLQEATPALVQLALPFDAGAVTEGEMVHGGVIATLADVAAVAGAITAAHDVPSGGATANLSISYLAPALGCGLVATARVLRTGRRQHVVRVEVADDAARPIAEALITVVLE